MSVAQWGSHVFSHLACTLTTPLFRGLVAKCRERLSHWARSLSHIGIGWVGFPLSSYKGGGLSIRWRVSLGHTQKPIPALVALRLSPFLGAPFHLKAHKMP